MFGKLTQLLDRAKSYEAACNKNSVHAEGDPLTDLAVAACEFVRAERAAKP